VGYKVHRGYIKLWRKIQDNLLWKEPRRFSRAEAWIDIIMEVQYSPEPQEVLIGNSILICNRGESLKSLETWAKRWNWDKSATRRFLILLKKTQNIDTHNELKTTRIKVINYNTYCPLRNANETQVKRKRNASETQVKPDNKDKKVNKVKNKEPNNIPFKEIINHLNVKTGKTFRPSSEKSRRFINARWNEGFRIEDFKKVIDIKSRAWKLDEKMNQFLRPETLFGTKFEGYLNEKKEFEISTQNIKYHRAEDNL